MEDTIRNNSFGRLVFGRAISDTARFFKYTRRDLILGAITVLLGGTLAYLFVGKADTMKELAFIAAFTLAPAGILMIAVFAWHLWLAPAAIAYEAALKALMRDNPPSTADATPKPPTVNWEIWKHRSALNLVEFAAILAKTNPASSVSPLEKDEFLRLIKEDAMASKLPVWRDRYAEGHEQPDLWPANFDVTKADAMKWAEAKGFDVSHIK